ncbi:MAG: low molecular weight phosphotyrosine protein phosphatase [Bacteroidota bacterium]
MATKILMVCLGNICRSPVADGIMQHKVNTYGIDASVDSAGTAAYHIGHQPDERSMANARKNGIDISQLRARQFTTRDFDDFDLIYVMDTSNYRNVMSLARNENDKAKVDLLMNVLEPGKNKSVPDPYYGGDDGFEQVFKMVEEACDALARKLIS